MSRAAAHFVHSARSGPQTIGNSVDLPGGQIMQSFLCQFPLDVSHCYVIVTLRIRSPWGGDVARCDSKECRSSQNIVLANVGSGDSRFSLGLELNG